MEVFVGSVVRSIAGRDKGEDFLVLALEKGFAFVANGKTRKVENPKKKKLKHLQMSYKCSKRITDLIASGNEVTNSEVRKALAELVSAN